MVAVASAVLFGKVGMVIVDAAVLFRVGEPVIVIGTVLFGASMVVVVEARVSFEDCGPETVVTAVVSGAPVVASTVYYQLRQPQLSTIGETAHRLGDEFC